MELASSFLELDQKGVSNMNRIIKKFIYTGTQITQWTIASTRMYQKIVPMFRSISVKTNLYYNHFSFNHFERESAREGGTEGKEEEQKKVNNFHFIGLQRMKM